MNKKFKNITNENQCIDTLPNNIIYCNKKFSSLNDLGYNRDKKTALTHMLCFAYGLKKTQESWKDVPDRELIVIGFRNRYGESVYGIYQSVVDETTSCKIKIHNKISKALLRFDVDKFFNGLSFEKIVEEICKN
jgi:hypothetical protein